MVTIKIDTKDYPITKGNHTVEELKALPTPPIAAADELDEIKGGGPHPIENGKTNIKGGEVFVSRPPHSGSSHH